VVCTASALIFTS